MTKPTYSLPTASNPHTVAGQGTAVQLPLADVVLKPTRGRKPKPSNQPAVLTTIGSFHYQIRARLELMGAKVYVAHSLAEAQSLMSKGRVDHLLLPGGADLHPSYYNEPVLEALPASPERDELEFNLADWALTHKVPTLAICRGHQVLTAAAGGTLYQDIFAALGNKHPNGYHSVSVVTGALRKMMGLPTARHTVNSYHHQSVKDVPEGWDVVAQSTAGIIESIYNPAYPVISVQWHPEAMSDHSAYRLFETFLEWRWKEAK